MKINAKNRISQIQKYNINAKIKNQQYPQFKRSHIQF